MSKKPRPTANELAALLALHKQWVESDGNEGQRANLADAELEEADLRDANLARANLNGARLRGAHLDGADLRDTTFFDADLTNADFGTARGLSFHNLAGADLTGAILPATIDPAAYLTRLGEITSNARTTFNTLMIASAYCVLTILTTTDDHLLRNASASPIPFTGTEAPILWFFKLMPFVITLMFVFFLVSLSRLWTSMRRLPAVFPDGSDLTTVPYSWVLTDVVRSYMPQLKSRTERQFLSFNTLLCYTFIFAPIATLFLFWWQYMPLRNTSATYLHVFFFSISVLATIVFIWSAVWKNIPTRNMIIRGVILVLCILLIVFVCVFSFQVFREDYDRQLAGCPSGLAVPLLCGLGHRSYVEVRYQTLSIRPANWTDPDETVEDEDWSDRHKDRTIDSLFAPVDGVDLREFDLSFADAQDAFLVKARLEGATLRQADLKFADLRFARLDEVRAPGAVFSWADLRRARFYRSDLEGAYLDNADLRGARFIEANLTGARLDNADLRGAFIQDWKAKRTSLRGADLSKARLPRADLKDADLESAQLQDANLVQADLRGANLAGANLAGANLAGANLHRPNYGWLSYRPLLSEPATLSGANLSGANLSNANLRGALLGDANLSGARLDGADLSENDSITEDQLSSACADTPPKLPERLSAPGLPPCPAEDASSNPSDQ